MTIPGLAILIIVLAFAEVAYRKVTGRVALPWMRPSDDEPDRRAAAIGFEGLEEMFGTGKRVEFEQRQAVLMHRENPGDGRDGVKVDLTSGTVKLRKL